ncbi:PNGase F N-terminal domain-containing protein [Limibacter armeniacum]|uniref:PNGase F N-terminal domain-containing protein n=1 Tax=Limibacter armeniacum TaxID=466084 RepID=UPI002FE675DD
MNLPLGYRKVGQLLVMVAFVLSSCSKYKELDAVGDKRITVFEEESIRFEPDMMEGKPLLEAENGVVRLESGRMLLKKVTLPHYLRETKASIKIILTSAGDPWDKSGSAFVLPKAAPETLMQLAKKELKLKGAETEGEIFPGIVKEEGYIPSLELMRFMTPFGVGHYSESGGEMDFRKPVYIPHWEHEVVWEEDITKLLPELEDEVWVGVWIDTWTKEGYKLSMELDFDESELAVEQKKRRFVTPVLNTVPYMGPIKHYDGFSKNDLTLSFEVPEGAKHVQLAYITTGHGGHAKGDEFVKEENILSLDGEPLYRFFPWRDDCASFRRFNPHSGTWQIKRSTKVRDKSTKQLVETEIEEFQASSDLSRSNWCPGSSVTPLMIPLVGVEAGQHTLTISIPDAQPLDTEKNEFNHWLVSAYLVGEMAE